jgi:hypothetical protein
VVPVSAVTGEGLLDLRRAMGVRLDSDLTLADTLSIVSPEADLNANITEASRLVVDAVSHSLETAEKLVMLYGIIGRIRLVSKGKVLAEAEKCVRRIVDPYESPNLTVEQVRASLDSDDFDPLKAFSSACRAELLTIAPTLAGNWVWRRGALWKIATA